MRVRFEMRMFGLVQWAPLRVWVSKHGFSRAGTPWHNYSAAGGFRQENMLMRELSSQEWSAPVPVPSAQRHNCYTQRIGPNISNFFF